MAVAGARRETRRITAGVIAVLLLVGALIGSFAVKDLGDLRPGPNAYNVGTWEVRNFPGKWLYLAGNLVRGAPSEDEQNAALQRFLELNARIDDLANQTSDEASRGQVVDSALVTELDALRKERDGIENEVEATIESRLSQVIEEEGLTRSVLGITDMVWPPVDTEFTDVPRALARSPRDHIELLGSSLLKEDLTLAQVEAIEAGVSQSENVSALSFPTSGVGAYPTIAEYPTDYRRAMEVIAHEWTHNYLFFRPLGVRYFKNNDLRTINETVANIVGQELAARVVERWPLESPAPSISPSTVPPKPGVDLHAELQKLRGDVDNLLADGKIDEAEALMEQRRRELADEGYFIRKINQAYFAYLNLYAGTTGAAAATNPIGPKVDALRSLSSSLSQFVDIVGNVTSVADLDRALFKLEGS